MINTIYIRTEANVTTAMGHMARCMTIADGIKELGGRAVFIVAEEGSKRFPEERGHEVICLNHKWDDFDGEIPIIEELIKEQGIERILVDSYFISEAYMQALKNMTHVSYIDDLYEKIWPVDMIIDYASYAMEFPYDKDYKDAELLLGPKYFPLRNDFRNVAKRMVQAKAKRILVVTGGSDEYHFMKSFMDIVSDDFEYHFICGNFNKDIEYLENKASSMANVTVRRTLPSLKEEMEKADIIVTAGGTTLYEAAATGLPIICFSFVDNQLFNVKSFDKGGYGIYTGDLRENYSFENLKDILTNLANDTEARTEMSRKLLELVDGQGARRIARKLIGYDFYGWEKALIKPDNSKYSWIKNPQHLYDILSEIWCEYTCAPRMRADWSLNNQTLGQCSITAFLAQDIFGGEVYGILRPGGNYHCYNVIGDCVFDLTSEQFGEEAKSLVYEDNPLQSREEHFSKVEKRERYEYLVEQLQKKCS